MLGVVHRLIDLTLARKEGDDVEVVVELRHQRMGFDASQLELLAVRVVAPQHAFELDQGAVHVGVILLQQIKVDEDTLEHRVFSIRLAFDTEHELAVDEHVFIDGKAEAFLSIAIEVFPYGRIFLTLDVGLFDAQDLSGLVEFDQVRAAAFLLPGDLDDGFSDVCDKGSLNRAKNTPKGAFGVALRFADGAQDFVFVELADFFFVGERVIHGTDSNAWIIFVNVDIGYLLRKSLIIK